MTQPQRIADSNSSSSETMLLRQQLADLRDEFREFVYRVSHDINAPMRSAVNFSELLTKKYGETLLDNQAHDYLTYITKGVAQSQNMLASLLEYSRINTLSNPPTSVDLNMVLERCMRTLQPNIDKTEAKITSDALPIVVGEPKQLEKLFTVLIENALAFRSPERPLEIIVGVKPTQNNWLFWVTDNGTGIAAKYHKEIFQIFRYMHNEIHHPGMGMGLALAHKIVSHHHGEIWVASEPNIGSSFYFTLPADDRLLKEGLI